MTSALFSGSLWGILVVLLLASGERIPRFCRACPPLRALSGGLTRLFQRGYWVFFAIALALALFARLYGWPGIPANYHTDGVMSAVDGYALARFGTDHYGASYPAMMEAWGYGQQSAMLAYAMSLSIRLFGLSRFAMRLPTLVVSLAGLLVFFDFARRLCGKPYALIALFLLALAPWHILQSRRALDAYMLCHFLLFAFYFLLLGLRSRPFLFVSMVFFALSMYCYGIASYVVPPMLLLLVVYLTARRLVRVRDALLCALVYLALSFPLILTMCINAFGLETVRIGPITCPRFEESVRSSDILFFTQEPFMDRFFANLLCALRITFLQSSRALGTDGLYGALYPFTAPLLCAGLFLWWRSRRSADLAGQSRAQGALCVHGGFLVLVWTLCAFAGCVVTNSVTSWRANAIFYPLTLLAAYAIAWACRRIRLLIPLFAALYLASFACCFSSYLTLNAQPTDSSDSPSGQYQALAYARTLPFAHLYLSTDAPDDEYYQYDAPTVRLLYVFELSPAQFQGEAEILGPSGEPIGLYDDVFEIWPPEYGDYEPDPEENAAYVIPASALSQFDPDVFHTETFLTYAVVYPKDMMPSPAKDRKEGAE